MYNLHCHSLLSDGVLLPSEIAARYAHLGYRAIAITDHVDYSNIETVVSSILNFTRNWPDKTKIRVLAGIELTHIPLEQFFPLAKYARKEGIKVIIGHGETPAEPVTKGTNRAALEADIDILAHPGLISNQDVLLAKEKNIFLELTARLGHRDTNRYVAKQALKLGAQLILNIDSHTPEDIITIKKLERFALSAGLQKKDINAIYANVGRFLKRREDA